MLATGAFNQDSHQHAFLPMIPSPLSPRSANIYGRPNAHMSQDSSTPKAATASTNVQAGKENAQHARMPFSKRAVKKAPVGNADEAKEKRRKMFLKKVREGREDKRFEARGEDMMRLDFMQRRRAWEAEQARLAPQVLSDAPEEDDDQFGLPRWDAPISSGQAQWSEFGSQPPAPEEDFDHYLQQEDQELEALLDFLPGEEAQMSVEELSSNLWSDDDDYDTLFAEIEDQSLQHVSQSELQGQQQAQHQDDAEAMDMS